MLNILHYFHVIYGQAYLPNEPNKLGRTDSIVIPFSLREQDSSQTRQFTDMVFEDSSPTHIFYAKI